VTPGAKSPHLSAQIHSRRDGFLDISLLGETYLYAAKIEQKIKQMRRDFGFMNPK